MKFSKTKVYNEKFRNFVIENVLEIQEMTQNK